MATVRLTMAQAFVRFVMAQRTIVDGEEVPLIPGCFGIFGHGNVSCLAEALEAAGDDFPTWRGQNEQSMALAAIGFAKAKKRRQLMMATSSIGPGATNMVTAAGLAHANRLPVLIVSGDVFANRAPDPVLQQVEHFGDPTVTVNDCFKPVARYWDRIQRPEQLLTSLPQAIGVLTDPADCGPAFFGLCQDAQAEAFDYPLAFFEPQVHHPRRPRADAGQIERAIAILEKAERPLVIAGGGVRYSEAETVLAEFAAKRSLPVAETIAGRAVLSHDHPSNVGPIGGLGSNSANALAQKADVVLAIGTRLQDFTTGSWTLFAEDAQFVSINAARFDALKHRALPVTADARVAIEEIDERLGAWSAPEDWRAEGEREYAAWNAFVDGRIEPTNQPSYAQVVGAVNRLADDDALALTAAGGMPGELCMNWRARRPQTFDCEFGFSCMGYEVAGGWGAKMADPEREVVVMVGDGSYLMMNSDVFSSVMTGMKLIIVCCDNGGFAVIDRLQRAKGSPSFNNLLEDSRRVHATRVDFAKHAESMGAIGLRARSIAEFEEAFAQAKAADRTTLIHIDVAPRDWTEGNGAWWEVGTPEVSERDAVRAARAEHETGKKRQRLGV